MPSVSDYHYAIVTALAVGLDALLGEPRRFHPLVYFGKFVHYVEDRLLGPTARKFTPAGQRGLGIVALVFTLLPTVLPFIVIAALLNLLNQSLLMLLEVLVLYLAIGNRSLREHALQVYHALHNKRY